MIAKEVLNIYSVRLGMQDDGVTGPQGVGKNATRRLVERLSQIDSHDKVAIVISGSVRRFVHVSSGDVIAELEELNT